MIRPLQVCVLFALTLLVGLAATADTTAITYPPSDGGVAALPKSAARKAIGILNPYDVAVCVAPVSTPSVCWPIIPGGTLYLDVSDAHGLTVRRCSGATAATCLPSGDAGVVTFEVQ